MSTRCSTYTSRRPRKPGKQLCTWIPKMDRVDRPEGRGNIGRTADAFFHPSRLAWRPCGPGAFYRLARSMKQLIETIEERACRKVFPTGVRAASGSDMA